MTRRSYQRQHLALWAAGYINGAGTSAVAFGCQMTRIAAGHYGLILDADNTLTDIDETFSFVQAKGTQDRWATVNDDSASLKTVRVFNASAAVNTDIEIKVFRSVLPNL